MNRLSVGQIAPDFRLPAVNSEGCFQLSNYRGKFVVLFFYPKNFTIDCTREVCAFRESFNHFINKEEDNTIVVGASPDDMESHRKFHAKYRLGYPLLSDVEHQVAESYGVWGEIEWNGKIFPSVVRSTFIISPCGKIFKTYYDITLKGHVQEVLHDLESEKRRMKTPH